MLPFRDVQLDLLLQLQQLLSFHFCLLVKLLVDGQDLHLALQAADGAHHSHIAVDSFVDDILDDQADLFCDVVVGTDELIYLIQLSVSLRQIQTAAL